jgi:hypothetical protein
MSEITDQFVELNRDETAEPNTVNVSVYRESQGLQNQISRRSERYWRSIGNSFWLKATHRWTFPLPNDLFLPLHVPMDEEVIESAEHEHCAADPNCERMKFAAHEAFVLSRFDADVSQHRAPDARAKQREERE